MLSRIDHVGIAVSDITAAIENYRKAFNADLVHEETNEAQGVREAMLLVQPADPHGASYIQLLEPTSAETPVGKFLAKHGPGIHHIAYGVADIDAALESLGAGGFQLINATPVHGTAGSRIAFVHPKSLGGVLTELVEASGTH